MKLHNITGEESDLSVPNRSHSLFAVLLRNATHSVEKWKDKVEGQRCGAGAPAREPLPLKSCWEQRRFSTASKLGKETGFSPGGATRLPRYENRNVHS